MSKHPPGPGMILSASKKGMDTKGLFSMHSTEAKQLWESYKIGTLSD